MDKKYYINYHHIDQSLSMHSHEHVVLTNIILPKICIVLIETTGEGLYLSEMEKFIILQMKCNLNNNRYKQILNIIYEYKQKLRNDKIEILTDV